MTMSDFNNNNGDNNSNKPQFGDTTLTKVFVGGLAWETPKQALYEHFEKFGEILEAVIISDKITGRSKGYGFSIPIVITLYSPTYIAADVGYNHKLSYSGGAYINGGHYPQMYPGQAMMAGANTLMPIYPFYPYSNHHQQHHHQAAAMGLPAHIYQPTSSGPITAQPPIISKPTTPVCVTSPS
uniref:RRM domain-containing protein n=1 Tax=Chenopodium quinoa TaxID=63459 RepID=A0A803LZ98_CHEQI